MEKRKLNIIIFIVSIMCSAIAMIYLPDILPSYFDAKGNIIRYASKYEKLLIYPIVSLLVNALLDFIEKRLFDNEHRHISGFQKKQNERCRTAPSCVILSASSENVFSSPLQRPW
mgnify:CR=1 FL=1